MTSYLQDHIIFIHFIVKKKYMTVLCYFYYFLIMLHVITILSLSYHAIIGLKEAYDVDRSANK